MNAELISLALALGLGLVIGAVIGARAGLRLAARQRAALTATAQLSRLWPAQLPQRTASDILSGVIRVALGGRTYLLPVLPRGAARRWLEALDLRFATLGTDLEKAGDDSAEIMVRLVSEADALLDMLLDYDRAGNHLLPDRATLDETASNTEILRAVVEVWRAVNPLADTVAGLDQRPSETTAGMQLVPPTTPPQPMAGDRLSSIASPTSSSSPTSTAPRSASSGTRATTTNGGSKRSGSARSSRTTRSNTRAGAPASPPRSHSRRATAEG